MVYVIKFSITVMKYLSWYTFKEKKRFILTHNCEDSIQDQVICFLGPPARTECTAEHSTHLELGNRWCGKKLSPTHLLQGHAPRNPPPEDPTAHQQHHRDDQSVKTWMVLRGTIQTTILLIVEGLDFIPFLWKMAGSVKLVLLTYGCRVRQV